MGAIEYTYQIVPKREPFVLRKDSLLEFSGAAQRSGKPVNVKAGDDVHN
jgi:hypothetical protein